MILNKKKYTLILNQQYHPLSIEGIKKTVKYFIDGGEALDSDYKRYKFEEWVERFNEKDPYSTIRSEKLWILIPDILIISSTHLRKSDRRFSKKKVFIRDNHKCGYCGISLNSSNRTLDHIIPVSKGGKTTYKNIVASCVDCNSFKGNRSLEDMERDFGWKLTHQLKDPSEDILYHVPPHKILKSWDPFLPKKH